MAKIVVQSHEVNYNGVPVPAFARWYADTTFLNDESPQQTVTAADVTSNNYVKQQAVSVSGGVVTIPAWNGANRLDSTLLDPSGKIKARYTLTLHDAKGRYITTVADNIKIPASPTTTTVGALKTLSVLPGIPYKAEYYPREEIDRILAGLISAMTKANDVTYGATALDTAPASLADPIAVGVNSPRVTKVLSADYGNSFATAISSIGSTETLLIVKADVTVSTPQILPANILLKQENFAVISKSGTGAIQFQGYGLADPTSRIPLFSGFAAGNITWTGSIYPQEISTELWDTANESLTDRVNRADQAFIGKRVKIIAYPRTITNLAVISDYHHLYFTEGNYPNTLNTWGTTYESAFALKDNTRVSGSNLAVLNESPNDGNTYMFYAFHMSYAEEDRSGMCENIIVEHLYIQGSEEQTDISGGNSVIHLGNGHNCHIRHITFNRVHGFATLMGAFGDEGNYAYNSSITHCTFIGMGSMLANFLNAENCWISDLHFDQTDSNNTALYTLIDCENNSFNERLNNITIERIRIYMANEDPLKNGNAIAIQPANISQNVTIRDVEIIGREITNVAESAGLSVGILARNVIGLDVSNVRILGAIGRAYQFQNCRYVRGKNNYAILSSDPSGNFSAMDVTGCADSDFADNIFRTTFTPQAQAAGIYESELEYLVTSSGSTVTNLSVDNKLAPFWAYSMQFVINGTTYIGNAVDIEAHTFTTTVAVGTLAVKTAASSTDVNTGTDTITLGAHNFQNGARLRYTAGSVAIGNLTTDTTYFVVGRTGTTIQLALTEGGAAIDLNATGTGTQTFTPVLRTKFSSNAYTNNRAPDGIALEPTGTSYKDKGEVAINPASINANTISTQTFTLQGARAGDGLWLNPPAALTAGLLISHYWVSNDNEISIVLNNTTAGAINEGAGDWNFILRR